MDALCSFAELKPVCSEVDVDLKGPDIKVGGQSHEMLQIVLPFEDVSDDLAGDFHRCAFLQLDVKERLLKQKLEGELSSQAPDNTKTKSKALQKALHAKATSGYMKKWRKGKRDAVEKDDVCIGDMLDELAPAVGAKLVDDPGKKAVMEFMKMHSKMEVRGFSVPPNVACHYSLPPRGLLITTPPLVRGTSGSTDFDSKWMFFSS